MNAERISEEKLRALLPPAVEDVICYRETDSTNLRARIYAEEHPGRCALIVADGQTAGKGRRGHTFDSAPGAGIYMSLVLCPDLPAERALRLTTAAAVAVCRAVEELTGAHALIKWVNDVYLNGKKAAGILMEGAFDTTGERFRYAVIGIGINVKSRRFPPEIADIATSIEDETGKAPGREELIALLVGKLLAVSPDDPSLTEEYRRRSFLIGQTVDVLDPRGTYPAEVIDVLDGGELLVRNENGKEIPLSSGDVSVKRRK